LILVFDALSSHAFEWPLSLFLLVVGVVWIIGVATLTLSSNLRTHPGSDWLIARRVYKQIAGYLPTNTKLFRI
jgi:hypothetical protein